MSWKKSFAVLVLLSISSCLLPPQYQDQYYLGDEFKKDRNGEYKRKYKTYGCVENPYIYHLDTYNWQFWEKRNYEVSCNRYRTGY